MITEETFAAARAAAVTKAVQLLYDLARRDSLFETYSGHLLLAFAQIATTSRGTTARRALEMGRERAAHWQRRWVATRPTLDSGNVMHEVIASYAAARLGRDDAAIRTDLARVLRTASTAELLYYDPLREPPPRDVPDDCAEGHVNGRGNRTCTECGAPLSSRSRYELFHYALTNTFFSERQALPLELGVADVLRQLPSLRPFPSVGDPEHYDAIYAATHVVYTLNGYGAVPLDRRAVADECAFLAASLDWALEAAEPDTLAEIIESLLALGFDQNDSRIVTGRMQLVECQAADGGWGDEDDDYRRFHNIWAAVDALRDFQWSR